MPELMGRDFTPPDIRGKVTGEAKYAEDFRRDGMVFCRLLTSPMPHARVTGVDASEALNMPGVVGILLPEDVPEQGGVNNNILTYEPHFVGEPILAIAANSETAAQDAIDAVRARSGAARVLHGSARESPARRPERPRGRQHGGAR